MSPVKNAEYCIAPLMKHITVPDRIRIRNGQGKPLFAHTVGKPTRKEKAIPADARSRTVLTVEQDTVIIQDTPVPDALTKRSKNAIRCTAQSTIHISVNWRH